MSSGLGAAVLMGGVTPSIFATEVLFGQLTGGTRWRLDVPRHDGLPVPSLDRQGGGVARVMSSVMKRTSAGRCRSGTGYMLVRYPNVTTCW